jgi:hypothetical protein
MVQRHRTWEIDGFGQLGRCRLILLFFFMACCGLIPSFFNDISLLWEGGILKSRAKENHGTQLYHQQGDITGLLCPSNEVYNKFFKFIRSKM